MNNTYRINEVEDSVKKFAYTKEILESLPEASHIGERLMKAIVVLAFLP